MHTIPVPTAVTPWFPRRGGPRPWTRGFLLTGSGIPAAALGGQAATPLFLETSRPGIFAIGDVRSGSVKRAAAGIGEGSMAVRLVFDRLRAAGSTNAIDLGPPGLGPARPGPDVAALGNHDGASQAARPIIVGQNSR